MRIIYCTDIHGSFSRVATLLFETVADMYIIGGDLIDIPFYNIDTAIYYHELQSFFHAKRRNDKMNSYLLEDYVESFLDRKSLTTEEKEKGEEYRKYTVRARRVMQQKYKVLENIMSFKSSAEVYALPGNYDMDLKFTALHERDMHLHWHVKEGLRIAGYGGADVWTAGIPECYIVSYNASIGIHDKRNEMHTFFKAIKPNIIVSHQPAHGIHDRLSKGPSGSPALRYFCDNNPVILCLTGHIHNDWGFKVSEDTVYLNPSNFGEVTTPQGEVAEGGFFYEIEINRGRADNILFRKLVEDRIHDIAEYRPVMGKWREDIIDDERYAALKILQNYDNKVQKYSHIPEIQLFNDIKQFFRMFQTRETEDRLKMLEDVVTLINERVTDIAMDVVGSVNMGISQKSSDIDIVLYLRCGSQCPDLHEQCGDFKKAKYLIEQALDKKYKFEIIDCIDLNVVERSIITQNYECETTQRFVAYRSICRPINYKVIAPIEDILNENIEFRKEMEGSIRSYFRIFATTSQHTKSFEKYEARLKAIGIKIPEIIRDKIRQYLQQEPLQ